MPEKAGGVIHARAESAPHPGQGAGVADSLMGRMALNGPHSGQRYS